MSSPQESAGTVRRVPRFGVFMGLGALIGVIAAWVLTTTGSFAESRALDLIYPADQVFGLLLLWTIPVGVALGGVVALIFDRVGRARRRAVTVEHERIIEVD